ncbi:MAG: hypothetical protein ABL995_17360 [Bryobacteraceae bacterium]
MSLTLLVSPRGEAAALSRGRHRNNSKITLRKRLHVNTLITEPGTAEIDWANLYSFDSNNFAMPSAVKYTPAGSSILWGRTEYSVAFDSIASADVGGSRLTQFSQALTLTGMAVLHDGDRFDLAVAPQATFFLRDESGSRLGAVTIARYDVGRNSLGGTLGWSGATRATDTNPAGQYDAGFGFGRQLSGFKFLERFTPHFNGDWEKPTGQACALAALEGVEFQATDRVAFDLSFQQFAIRHTAPDRQIVLGLTINLGHAH